MGHSINMWHFTDPNVSNRPRYIFADYSSRLYLLLFFVYMGYAVLNSISAIFLDYLGISDLKWPEALIELGLYCVLLYAIYRVVRHIRTASREKNGEKEVFAAKDLELIVNRSLLISALYLILIGIFDAPELFGTSAIIYITFFVGFTISLGELVACETDKKFIKCFKKALVEVGVIPPKWKEIFLIVLLLIIAVLITQLSEMILLFVVLAMIIFCVLVDKIRLAARRKINRAVYNVSKGRNVLVLEYCVDNAVTSGVVAFLKNKGAKLIKLGSISKAQKNKYDVVIISNILSKTNDIQKYLKRVNKYLAEDGVVIAPACISKKERKPEIFTKFSFEHFFLEPLTKEEYIENITKSGWAVYNTFTVYDPTRITYVEMRRGKELADDKTASGTVD